ncbi:MAG: DUF3006 domain-containing protein [Bacillota bacterium]
MQAVIDRFEGGFAICQSLENGDMQNIARSQVPPEAKEGDVLSINGGNITIDKRLTEKRKASIQKKVNGLWD